MNTRAVPATSGTDNESVIDWMVLSQLPGIGIATFWSLVDRFGSPGAVLQCSAKQLQENAELRKNQLLGFGGRDEIRSRCLRQLTRLAGMGGHCITIEDDRYPENLRQISDPPPLLYCLGESRHLQGCCIAMVGSRAATSYGCRTAANLAGRLAGNGVTIVSGLALGVDTEAHRGALRGGGATVAVLGCGVDIVYPRQNRPLFREIAENGAIVSEYPLGTPPEGFRFPARNRIIAGLSRGVVVVEAARKSGSLITAQLALDEGREVYAVPGQVDSYKSEGAHLLLQQGATLVLSEKDILDDLGIAGSAPDAQAAAGAGRVIADPRAAELLCCIETYPTSRNELIVRSGMEVFEFSELLLLLELEGAIEILPGDEIRRIP